VSDLSELRSGAMPGHDAAAQAQEAAKWGHTISWAEAHQLASEISAESVAGRDGLGADQWDLDRHSMGPVETRRVGNRRRPSGIPYGYGDHDNR
jgi:hypothetical protein